MPPPPAPAESVSEVQARPQRRHLRSVPPPPFEQSEGVSDTHVRRGPPHLRSVPPPPEQSEHVSDTRTRPQRRHLRSLPPPSRKAQGPSAPEHRVQSISPPGGQQTASSAGEWQPVASTEPRLSPRNSAQADGGAHSPLSWLQTVGRSLPGVAGHGLASLLTDSWTLMLVSPRGGRARSLRLGVWGLPLSCIALVGYMSLCVVAGWHLQATAVVGPSAQVLGGKRPAGAKAGWRWSPFARLAATKAGPTIRQMRVQADLERAERLGLGTVKAAGKLLAGLVDESWVAAAGRHAQVPKSLVWPVPEGYYVRGFGSGEGGYHLAVDMSGEVGVDVVAAADAIVGYSGDRVRGYGKMVILIHPGGWVTVYAHNSRNLVVAGQRLKSGQLIAKLGNTGISRGPHVHFEFIHSGRNCDPVPLFRPGIQHRKGWNSPVAQVAWNSLDKRPGEVACGPRRRHPRSRYYEMHPSEETDTAALEGAPQEASGQASPESGDRGTAEPEPSDSPAETAETRADRIEQIDDAAI